MIIEEDDYLAHYGVLRRSGRYPWGSGGPEKASNDSFLGYVEALKKQGLGEKEIAEALGTSITSLRAAKSIAKNEIKQGDILQAQKLKEKGYSNVAIGERMGKNESSVRALLAPGAKDKADALFATSDMLKRVVDEKQFVDVGAGVEHHLGISKERLNTAVAVLREQGYEVHSGIKVKQLGTGHETELKILAPPGVTWADAARNKLNVQQVRDFSTDQGRTYQKPGPPIAINPSRVKVRYKEDGGDKEDGVIYVRPGKEDLSLGGKRYGQVRIQVGDGHYLKGMAIYKDDLPDGVDLMFNTNKSDTGNKLDAMKKLNTKDPDLPFSSVTRPVLDSHGKQVKSVMNLVNDEGDWDKWSRTLSTQMLSKQSPTLVKEQLDLTFKRRKEEFDEIKSLTNPTVRKKLLETFADSTDSAAVHMKAARLPGQATQVILPVSSLKPTEIYAPNFNHGDKVVLIRYPHGGKFEIPEVTVNNRHAGAKKLLGDAKDAIGIHHSVAERMSGADFDGDTVLVIPNNKGKVKTEPALDRLKGFDPKHSYPKYEGMKVMDARTKGIQMGRVSNLITDMTIKGAPHSDLVNAVRHSMVVIDAEKHELDWKRSEADHGIAALSKKYQGRSGGGAATLISRAGGEAHIDQRKLRSAKDGGPIDPDSGRLVYVPTGRTRPNGAPVKDKVDRLSVTDDAHALSSGTRVEHLYADYSNATKAMANEARLEYLRTPSLKYSPSAKAAYKDQVDSLNSKLFIAQMNAPRERQAQIVANAQVRAKRAANPDLDKDEVKKVERQALADARARLNPSGKTKVDITEDEWKAIQAGAISNNKLADILDNADLDKVKALATPRAASLMTATKVAQAKSLLNSGYTRAEVARRLGVSVSTMNAELNA